MKPINTSKRFPGNPAEIAAAIARAPEHVVADDTAYDLNDPAAVRSFWAGASVRRPGQRGPGKKPTKVLLSVRYSREVVDFFKATGEGWQTRMDEALQQWVAGHRSRT